MTIKVKVITTRQEVLDSLRIWRSCTDPKSSSRWPRHKEEMERQGWCPNCGEATFLRIRDGDSLKLYIHNGALLRADSTGVTHIFDYAKVRELFP